MTFLPFHVGSKIAFHGSRIVMSVVKELLAAGLKDASKLILAGSRYVVKKKARNRGIQGSL